MSTYAFRFYALDGVTNPVKGIMGTLRQATAPVRAFRSDLASLSPTMERVESKSISLGKSLKMPSTGIGGLTNMLAPLKTAIAGAFAVHEIFRFGNEVVNVSDRLKVADSLILGITRRKSALGEANVAAKELSDRAGISFVQGKEGLAQMLTVANGNVNKAKELTKLAAALQGINPAEGFEGALFALKELETGDTMSLRERFNIRVPTASEAQKIAKRDGKSVQEVMFGELNKYLDNTYGGGAKGVGIDYLLNINQNTAKGQVKNILNAITDVFLPFTKNVSTGIVSTLKPVSAWIKDNAANIRSFFKGAWDIIQPILGGLWDGLKVVKDALVSIFFTGENSHLAESFDIIRGLAVGIGVALSVTGRILAGTFKVIHWFKDLMIDAFSWVGRKAAGLATWLSDNNPVAIIIRFFKQYLPGFQNLWDNAIGMLKKPFVLLKNWLWDNFFGPIVGWFKGLADTIRNPFGGGQKAATVEVQQRNIGKAQGFLPFLKPKAEQKSEQPKGILASLGEKDLSGKPVSDKKNDRPVSSKLDSAVSGGGNIKHININIGKQIENLTIQSEKVEMSKEQLTNWLRRLLLDTVNDVNYQ